MFLRIKFLYFHLIVFIYVWNNSFKVCDGKQNILTLNRPVIVYYNNSYVQNISITMKIYNRTHPFKFVTLKADVVYPLDNSVVFNFYLYELLSNVYKRSFVEYHVGTCDTWSKGTLVSNMVKDMFYRIPEPIRPMKFLSCPIIPGHYELRDMKLDLITIPAVVPFVEGRLYVNATHAGRVIYCVYTDFIIKTIRHKKH